MEKLPRQKFSLLKCEVTKHPTMLSTMIASAVHMVAADNVPSARANRTTANAIICHASKNEFSTENAMPRFRRPA